jgi:hypothetical protein
MHGPGIRGRQRSVLRGRLVRRRRMNIKFDAVRARAGKCRQGLARRKRQTSGGRDAHGRKNAAFRQGCRVAESLVGRGRALVASANHRAAHVSGDESTSSKMRVGAMRMYEGVRHTCATARAGAFWNAAKTDEHLIRRSQNADGVARKPRRRAESENRWLIPLEM